MNGTSRKDNRKSFVQDRRGAQSPPVKAAFAALMGVTALVCLSGCASLTDDSKSDFVPGQYNPSTGYPAVGGGVPYHM